MPSSIRPVRLVGVPSSPTDSEPRRAAMVPSSTTATPLAATSWPTRPAKAEGSLRLQPPQAGKGRGLLAVEVTFKPMADRFMQHHAGPAGPQHDFHLAGGRRHGV